MQDVADIRWADTVHQLVQEAQRRGGQAVEETDSVRLEPPISSGEPIEVMRYDDGTAIITTGLTYLVGITYTDENGPREVTAIVVAIMNGLATESVEIADDGARHNIVSAIDDGMVASRMADPRDIPIEQDHPRRIQAWPTPTTQEHLDWSVARAVELVDQGRPEAALAVWSADVGAHRGTRHLGDSRHVRELLAAYADGPVALRLAFEQLAKIGP